jgi:D-sedoheptulose 7-phosphate isomerase
MPNSLSALFDRYPSLRECEHEISEAARALIECFQAGNKLLVCGNGGSAADTEHIVSELMKGFIKRRRIPERDASRLAESAGAVGLAIGAQLQGALPAISLVSQTSLISAITNDTSGELVFAQQVYGLGKSGDVLLGISTSGNSKNVINALAVAKAFGLGTIVLTGRSGGAMAPMADIAIRVPAEKVPEIQELHLPVYHWLCIAVEAELFPDA